MNQKSKSVVAVAMSGGLDSSVAAWILLQEGYSVFGVTMAHMDGTAFHQSPSTPANAATRDAALVCRHYGIPHHVIDLREAFREKIIHSFVRQYLEGLTPNPCVLCNAAIKWGELLACAQQLGADYFATGHYARLQYDETNKRYMVLKAKYEAKDQSYALWQLNQKQLAKTIFPLGELSKMQVRLTAERNDLPVAQEAESQDICFIPDDDYKNFLRQVLKQSGQEITAGDIYDSQGRKIGQHQGYPFYTIGQRKGIGVALGKPVYVTHIDAEHNRITVGEKKDLLARGLIAEQVNFVSTEEIKPQVRVEVRIRYKDPGYAAIVDRVRSGIMSIHFEEPRPAVTPGQSAVLYDGHLMLAGGIIREPIM